jgi:cytochrome P450
MLSSLVDHVSSPQPPLLPPLAPAASTISASAVAGLTIFLAIAVGAILTALYKYLLPKPIPGIPYNPEAVRCLLGDAPSMMRDERGPMDWLLDQGRRHSGPICQLFLRPFSKPFVLISDFREAQDVMLRRKEWDRSDYSIELLGGQAPYHHINQKTGPVWKAHRRLLQDLMMPAFLHRVAAPNIYASTLDLVELWTAKERLAGGRPFSAENDIFHASLDSVLEFSFGSAFPHRAIPPQQDLIESHLRLYGQHPPTNTTPRLPTTCHGAVEFASAPVHETIEATLHASIAMGDLMDSPFPRLSWWFKSKMPYQAWAIRTRNRYLKEQVTRAVQRMSDNETDLKNETWVRSAVDLMMLRERMFANKEGRQPIYWSPSIRDEVIGFIVAGHDTTSTTVLWGLKFLSDSQISQNKLRDALEAAHSNALEERRLPSAEEITRTNIPYLEAVIEEILRLANTLPVLDRQTSEDTELLGYHIPKGTILMMLNRGPSFTEPGFAVDEKLRSPTCRASGREKGVRQWPREGMDAFYPERWLVYDRHDEGEATATYDSTAGPSLPFGLGTRGCFGRKLAYLELRIMITLLVWQFRLGKCSEALSGYGAVETLTHKPKDCYVRLERMDREGEKGYDKLVTL